MSAIIRVLHLEDSDLDAELISVLLSNSDIHITVNRVSTKAAYEAALAAGGFDVVIADYSVPGITGTEALDLAKAAAPHVPVIYVSGTLGEETAIEVMKRGASDYVLKQRLARLALAVPRVMAESIERRRRVQAETDLQTLNATLEARVADRTRELFEANDRLRDEMMERRRAEARLRLAQKAEALGQLAGGVAHDVNNVLQAVLGGARMTLKHPDDPPRVERLANMIIAAAERGAAVTRRLLGVARQDDLQAVSIQPAGLISDIRIILDHTLGANVRVVSDCEADVPDILADRSQLETVLVNLATNARDAMGAAGGALTFRTALDSIEAGQENAPAAPGSYVRLSVSDTGCGMDAETLAKAADPFYTTKPRGKGTGLGLAMARGFAEQSGGGLQIESTPGQGTTVSIWLPIATSGFASALDGENAIQNPAQGAKILVVDDEPLVRMVIAESLRDRGLNVTEAPGAPEALAYLEGSDDVDLLITDLAMPGTIDGLSLIEAARSTHPQLPAVLITGHAGDASHSALATAANDGPFMLLRKPVAPDNIAAAAAAVLQGWHASAAA